MMRLDPRENLIKRQWKKELQNVLKMRVQKPYLFRTGPCVFRQQKKFLFYYNISKGPIIFYAHFETHLI